MTTKLMLLDVNSLQRFCKTLRLVCRSNMEERKRDFSNEVEMLAEEFVDMFSREHDNNNNKKIFISQDKVRI